MNVQNGCVEHEHTELCEERHTPQTTSDARRADEGKGRVAGDIVTLAHAHQVAGLDRGSNLPLGEPLSA